MAGCQLHELDGVQLSLNNNNNNNNSGFIQRVFVRNLKRAEKKTVRWQLARHQLARCSIEQGVPQNMFMHVTTRHHTELLCHPK